MSVYSVAVASKEATCVPSRSTLMPSSEVRALPWASLVGRVQASFTEVPETVALRPVTRSGAPLATLIYGIALVSKHIQYVMLNQKMIFIVCIVAAIIIICLAPVDTINKALYDREKRRFKCISGIIVFVELFLLVSLKSFDTIEFMLCIVFVLESIFLIIQAIVNYFRKIRRLENYD